MDAESTPKDAAVVLRDVSFSFGRVPVLEEVSLTIDTGDFLGVIGPNGGGKTTLIRLILGLLAPDSGEVRVFDLPARRARTLIGYVPQYARFPRDFPLSVREVVAMGRLGVRGTGLAGIVRGGIVHGGMGWRTRPEDAEAIDRALGEVELTSFAERPLSSLSGGELQRVMVARSLAGEPRLLLLDEPTSSADSRMEKSFYDLLQRLNQRIPIVLVSHDLGFISAYLTRVACLNRRLEVKAVSEVHTHDLESMYDAPVKAWSHDCEL